MNIEYRVKNEICARLGVPMKGASSCDIEDEKMICGNGTNKKCAGYDSPVKYFSEKKIIMEAKNETNSN